VAGLRRLHCVHAQAARLVRSLRQNFNIQTHAVFISTDVAKGNDFRLSLLSLQIKIVSRQSWTVVEK
jgi:hypothetical protein